MGYVRRQVKKPGNKKVRGCQMKKPGNKKVQCPHCGGSFKAKRLEIHEPNCWKKKPEVVEAVETFGVHT